MTPEQGRPAPAPEPVATGGPEAEPVEAEVVEPEVVETEVVEAEVVEPEETTEQEGDLLSAELTAAQAELDEYRDTLQRLKAEFDNYKRRVVREQTALVERATGGLIRELLPVLDAFEAALDSPVDGSGGEKLREGLEKVWQQLSTVLGQAGLERIADVDVPFDPQRHEAVMSEPDASGGAEGGPTVCDVFRSGWSLKGHVIRPAAVKVKG